MRNVTALESVENKIRNAETFYAAQCALYRLSHEEHSEFARIMHDLLDEKLLIMERMNFGRTEWMPAGELTEFILE